jgi:hypothetical protein
MTLFSYCGDIHAISYFHILSLIRHCGGVFGQEDEQKQWQPASFSDIMLRYPCTVAISYA